MTQKSILITGCSSGIGYDAAHGLRDKGWRVFASCRKAEDCERLIAEGFESPRIDYMESDSIQSAVQEVLTATGGTLDALFNNGAFGLPAAVEDLPRGALVEIFETNVFGWHELTRALIPAMRAQGHGRIVQNSSVLGLVGYKWRGAYVATKFAIEGLSDVMRIELKASNIHVVLIEPGPITSMFREKAVPYFERWIDWKGSARRQEYMALRSRLYKKKKKLDPFELPASAVTAKLYKALTRPRPKTRYYVTTPTYVAGYARRLLPDRGVDWILSKF